MAEEFKDILRGLRKHRGLTQEQLASVLDVPESTIRRYEVMPGTPKRERLELIADYFNVSVDYLIGRHEETEDGISEFLKAIDLQDDEAVERLKGLLVHKGKELPDDFIKELVNFARYQIQRKP